MARRQHNKIVMLQDAEGNWVSDDGHLRHMAVNFFKELYSKDMMEAPTYQIKGKFPPLTTTMLNMLNAPVTKDEIRLALVVMKPLKNPRPDGLHATFFQHHWEVVGDLIYEMVTKVFQGADLEKGINKTIITLIPKVARPTSIKDFRPISLLNVSYKVITKLIANRLKSIMPSISGTQASFVEGQSISDNIIVIQKIIHSTRHKIGKVGWMTIKVDLEKAYDRLSWDFIEDTLFDVGFPQSLVRVIMQCVCSGSIHLLWNGEITEEFILSRGIRQGDSLSSYIFVLCMEHFSQYIDQLVNYEEWLPVSLNKKGPQTFSSFFG